MSYTPDYTLFTGTADKTVANTSSETSGVPAAGTGSMTLPANFFDVGRSIRIKGGGIFSTLITPGNLTVKVKYGSTVMASVTIGNLLASATNNAFDFECTITCRTTGASGTATTAGLISYETGTLARGMAALNNTGATATIDTTAAALIDVTVTWATANASNTLTTTTASMEILN